MSLRDRLITLPKSAKIIAESVAPATIEQIVANDSRAPCAVTSPKELPTSVSTAHCVCVQEINLFWFF